MEKSKRIIGFDLARAYAIFGMYIVNFNIVFGNYYDATWMGKLLSLFSGNSSSVFVTLAGMGVALMTGRANYLPEEKQQLRRTVGRRAWFLFVVGLLFYNWWPADILHFYGGYLHMAVPLLFVDKKYFLYTSLAAVLIFHGLLFWIPFETGWNFETLVYQDFWTWSGFMRNTLYNGWNSIFPWMGYFAVGMYLGRLDWSLRATQARMFLVGLLLYLAVLTLQLGVRLFSVSESVRFFLEAEYLPPFLPFLVSTTGFGLMLISVFMWVSPFVAHHAWAQWLVATGQMTLTHYVSHLTLGMMLLAAFAGRSLQPTANHETPLPPHVILGYATFYFLASVWFSGAWAAKRKHGPLEWLMRKLSN